MNWSVFDKLTELVRADLQQVNAKREPLLHRWNQLLAEFGGDPSGQDWTRFRPLRVSREEDWSDWLAFLMESSVTGFAERLLFLSGEAPSLGSCIVEREVRTRDGERRGDLIIRWEKGQYAHIEVKVGNTGFEKTFKTCVELKRQHTDAVRWDNFLLLPDEDLDKWHETKDKHENGKESDETTISEITWEDVAIGLRRILSDNGENQMWRAWAVAFVGNVEQLLLGHPCTETTSLQVTQLPELDRMARQTTVWQKGLEDD